VLKPYQPPFTLSVKLPFHRPDASWGEETESRV